MFIQREVHHTHTHTHTHAHNTHLHTRAVAHTHTQTRDTHSLTTSLTHSITHSLTPEASPSPYSEFQSVLPWVALYSAARGPLFPSYLNAKQANAGRVKHHQALLYERRLLVNPVKSAAPLSAEFRGLHCQYLQCTQVTIRRHDAPVHIHLVHNGLPGKPRSVQFRSVQFNHHNDPPG